MDIQVHFLWLMAKRNPTMNYGWVFCFLPISVSSWYGEISLCYQGFMKINWFFRDVRKPDKKVRIIYNPKPSKLVYKQLMRRILHVFDPFNLDFPKILVKSHHPLTTHSQHLPPVTCNRRASTLRKKPMPRGDFRFLWLYLVNSTWKTFRFFWAIRG